MPLSPLLYFYFPLPQSSPLPCPCSEPWLFGDEVLSNLRSIVRTRYTYLPLWYTLFAQAHASGAPTMRPMWYEFPADAAGFGIEDQWMVGSDLLVKPVVTPGSTSVDVYFPLAATPGATGTAYWYDVETYARTAVTGTAGVRKTVDAPLAKIPVFQRGGAIVPRQMRVRRSSALMANDPYTLVVTLSPAHAAYGTLYLDDGITFDHARKNAFRLRAFDYAPSGSGSSHVLKSTLAAGGKSFAPGNTVERVVVAGVGKAPASIVAADADGATRTLTFSYDAASDVLTIRKPGVKVAYDWTITLNF